MKKLIIFLIAILFFGFVFPSTIVAANIPLEIIFPRTGMDAENRANFAYPNIEYRIRLSVLGGLYPFTFSLTTFPSGMTINSSTGEIIWTAAASGSHNVTAKVVDDESTEATVSWAIAAGTSNFIFVDDDAVCNGNAGTIGDPFCSIDEWYDEVDDTYADKLVYFRAGSYEMPPTSGLYYPGSGALYAMRLYDDHSDPRWHPIGWMAYEDESVTIDMEPETGKYVTFYFNGVDNIYIDNITFTSVYMFLTYFKTPPTSTDVYTDAVFRRITSASLDATAESNNESWILFYGQAAGASALGQYVTIQDCSFSNVNSGTAAAIKIYETKNIVIEDNTIDNVDGGDATISIKNEVTHISIRHNILKTEYKQGIGGTQSDVGLPTDPTNIDISFNYVKVSDISVDEAVHINRNADTKTVWIYRNTFVGRVIMTCFCEEDTGDPDGPVYLDGNVLINNDSGQIYLFTGDSDCTSPCTADTSRIHDGDTTSNLKGTLADNIVDASGNLTPDYSSYLGTHGWQIGGEDTISPTLTGYDPADEETDVPIPDNIYFEIDDNVGTNLYTLDFTIALVDAIVNGVCQSGYDCTMAVDGNGYNITINPDDDLDYDTEYGMAIFVQDTSGNSVANNTWDFTTEAEPQSMATGFTLRGGTIQ